MQIKQKEWEDTLSEEIKTNKLKIKNIKYIGEQNTRCITVSNSDGLYVTDNKIITHNSPSTLLCQFLCSYSLKKSSELLLEPFFNILSAAPFYERIHSREKMVQANEEYNHMEHIDKIFYTTASPTSELSFAGGSNIKLGSNPQSLIGATICSIVFSELGWFFKAGKSSEYVMELYTKGKSRIDSRLHGSYFGRTIVDSSPSSTDNAIDHYIVFDAPRSEKSYIVKGAIWEYAPENYSFDRTFKVYIGGAGIPPRIIDSTNADLLNDERYKSKIIEVPESERTFFKEDIVEALKDRAGIPAGNSNMLITNYDNLEMMFKYNLKNIYECIHAPSELSPSRLIFNQVKDTFFRSKANKYEFYYKPNIPRCIAVDQSYSTDMTGISMCHVERFMDTGELIYVVDFTIAIAPTKDSHINLDAIRCFIEELRDLGNLRIEAVGFDSFQSEPAMQHLDRSGFKVKKVSADKSMDPYMNMISLMNSGRIAVGKNIFLKNNLKSLSIINKKSKMKVDHDTSREVVTVAKDHSWANSPLGMYSKDISDSMVDAIELCRTEFPIAEEQWWGPIKEEDLTPVVERSKAEANLKRFLNNFNLK